MTRFQISLNKDEAEALARLAASELRDPRDQIRLVIRRELERLGLWPPNGSGQPQQAKGQEVQRESDHSFRC